MTTTPTGPTETEERAAYARTDGDMLVGGYDGPGINPSDQAPVWWIGLDTGGGAYPIGPHGPWHHAHAAGRPVVTRATSLITGPLSAAPFRVLELGTGGQPIARPRWITDPMLMRPDGRFIDDVYPLVNKLPRGEFWASWIRTAIWWGEGAFITQEDETGMPLAGTLRLVSNLLLTTKRVDGSLRWALDGEGGDPSAVFSRDGYLDFGNVRYRIVVLRNPHSPVDAEGRSAGVFAQHPEAFRLAGQIDTYTSGTFRSGIPAGYLQTETPGMTQPQADDLKAKWLANHGGDRRSIAVLNATTRFVPLQMSPIDAAVDAMKRLSIADVAYAFGLDPEVLGVTLANSSTYRNAQEFWQRHKDFGLAPWISPVQDVLTSLLPGTQGVAVDLDRFANPTAAERFDAYKVALDAGILTLEEVRTLEGLPPLPSGDTA